MSVAPSLRVVTRDKDVLGDIDQRSSRTVSERDVDASLIVPKLFGRPCDDRRQDCNRGILSGDASGGANTS